MVWRSQAGTSEAEGQRPPPLPSAFHPSLTLVGWEGREVLPGQEVAVGNLVAISGAWNSGHCADAVSIVTDHIQATEARQAA